MTLWPNMAVLTFGAVVTLGNQGDIMAQHAGYSFGDEKYHNWEKNSVEDMNAYFEIMIIMGLMKLPALSDCWRREPLFHCIVL